ncbi:MAG: S8 family serine peptidase [Planctomycetes bacterium]|nr:S8 family serine peptidase [Planctomycetota bacterium]
MPPAEVLETRILLSATGPEPAVLDLSSLQVATDSYAESHILVKFQDAAQATGQRLGQTDWYQVLVDEGTAVFDAVANWWGQSNVVYAQPDYTVRIADHITPNDRHYNNGGLWGLNNLGHEFGTVKGTAGVDIDAAKAWDVTTGSSNVVVAVIDTGVDYTHPDLAGNIWTNVGEVGGVAGEDDDGNGYVDDIYGWDFHNNDNDPMDDHSHGTHVAGTIGAVGNNDSSTSSGTAIVGVAWDVSIMGLKFLSGSGSGSTSNAIRALDYATWMRNEYIASSGTRGANVLVTNNSWGGGGYDQALKDAIDRSGAVGTLFVAAAGNGDFLGRGQDNDSKAHYPSSYTSENIIAVAATDRNDNYASFSNYGATSVDLAAPGVEIWSTIPFNKDTSDGSNDGYARYNGTSMATPHVSGAIALMLAANPALPTWDTDSTTPDVKSILLETVDPITGRDTVTDGRLNAGTAVARAAALAVPTLSIDDVTIAENGGDAVFTVRRSGNTSTVVTVDYATQDETAKVSGSDYVGAVGTLNFAVGDTEKKIYVSIQNDTEEELRETFYVNLLNASAGASLGDPQGRGTIIDDDGPTISIDDVSVAEGTTGTTDFTFTVKLSTPSAFPVSISYATADRTGTLADADYVNISGTLEFAPGDTVKTVVVAVNGDTAFEPDETFAVILSNPTHGTLADAEGIGTILNDDAEPVGDANEMYVRDMDWLQYFDSRGRRYLDITVDVNRDSDADGSGEDGDAGAAGASVTLVLIHDSNGNGVYGDRKDKSWSATASTGTGGTVTFTLSRAPAGNYKAQVTQLSHATYTWDVGLDGENPDYFSTSSNSELGARSADDENGRGEALPSADGGSRAERELPPVLRIDSARPAPSRSLTESQPLAPAASVSISPAVSQGSSRQSQNDRREATAPQTIGRQRDAEDFHAIDVSIRDAAFSGDLLDRLLTGRAR